MYHLYVVYIVNTLLLFFSLLFLRGWSGGGGGGDGAGFCSCRFVLFCFCSCLFLLFFGGGSFCLVCLFSVVC